MDNSCQNVKNIPYIDETNITAWLLEHIEESKENNLSLDAIIGRMNTSLAKNIVSKSIKKLFKNVLVKRERSKDNWSERKIKFHGIFWRYVPLTTDLNIVHFDETGNLITTDLITLRDIEHLRKDFIHIDSSAETITIGHLLKYSINSYRIVVEAKFYSQCTWFLSVCGRTDVMPSTIGMPDTFFYTKSNILGLLDGVSKLRICKGIPYDDYTNVHFPEKIIHETLTCHADKNSIQKVYRSNQCSRLISFRALGSVSVCVTCKEMMKKYENQNPVVPPTTIPVVDIINVDLNNNENNFSIGPAKQLNIDSQVDNNVHETSLSTSNAPDNGSSDVSIDDVALCPADDSDMSKVFEEVINMAPPKINDFLLSQKNALSCKPQGRRWSKSLIRISLTLFCRSPKCYKDLRDSGFLLLPSQRRLQIYKNKINQKPGINKDLMHWMRNEALSRNLPPDGFVGGLILDEMSIQSDLEFCCRNGNTYLWGFKEVTDESQYIDSIISGKKEVKLATHVLQFVFLGFSGFRFPLFHFPTDQTNASELYLILWKIIDLMATFGFQIEYISMDGAQTNRDFAKLLLGTFKSSSIKTMTVQNVFSLTPDPIFVIMDYSHLIKKIRNNIHKSGRLDSYKRHLKFHDHFIYWEHFVQAYMWDISHNPFPIYQKLRQEHFQLTSESKMRNYLAEDVLNKDMLHLMNCYSQSLQENTHLKSTIELLEKTSVLVANFRDKRPIREVGDYRLTENEQVLKWFCEWETEILNNDQIKDKEKHLISHQTRADICSLIIGFKELCAHRLTQSSTSIIASRLNSDIIENVFCQQRGLYNGNNTNPTYLNYSRTMNTVILGQTTISRKSNAAPHETAADPFSTNL